MNWYVVTENLGQYAAGARLTLLLTVVSLLLAFCLAVPLAFARNSADRRISGAVQVYTTLFRGTPLLVQLFLIYFGLAQFGWLRASILWPWLSSPLVCAILTFVLNSGAYTTEIFAGGLRAIPKGEVEAARACGFSPLQAARRILIPAMLTRALPLYGNEVIMMLHATSLASTVTLLEVTGVARNLTLNYYIQLEPYAAAALIYLGLTAVLVGGFQILEARHARYLRLRR
ncbi:ABC transporter permease subunit [Pseudooceanicola sp. CBS1P-1]|uniref:ABC transporter permease subunit n=1 Tax=Pseudooceanicola albus TaxID=2692189 RepID=A0A6L7G7B2_9RHOB|nr:MULTISPECIES: ABC transporter permease subunit [Pseudooceanicola]MBT9385145.1 ABC transporter permease subunit [Pseudooceanicola endophyticus]MXN18563.1 ABC transporter permease subunit [Pseudooceanicola albus]